MAASASSPRPALVVIDTDDAMRELVREWTAAAGYRVQARADAAFSGDADVNLVVVDLRDPATKGAAIVSRIQELYPAAAVLGLSARASRPLAGRLAQALAPGLAALLPKPCTRAELLAAVDALLSAGGGPAR